VAEFDPAGGQSLQRQLAPPPHKIVDRDNRTVRHFSLERQGEMRADKTRTTGDHYSHLTCCHDDCGDCGDCGMQIFVTAPAAPDAAYFSLAISRATGMEIGRIQHKFIITFPDMLGAANH
jgi:hypothetical protein